MQIVPLLNLIEALDVYLTYSIERGIGTELSEQGLPGPATQPTDLQQPA